MPKTLDITRILREQKEQLRAGFQDRLVMTASITLRVCYLIVFFLAFRILDRDQFGQVFYRLENGVFWTSFGGRRLASSRGRLKFQDRLGMVASVRARRRKHHPATRCSGLLGRGNGGDQSLWPYYFSTWQAFCQERWAEIFRKLQKTLKKAGLLWFFSMGVDNFLKMCYYKEVIIWWLPFSYGGLSKRS